MYRKWLIPLLLGLCGGLAAYATGLNIILSFVLGVFAAAGSLLFGRIEDRRARICFWLAGLFVMLCAAFGWRLESAGETGWKAIGLCILSGLLSSQAAGWVMYQLAGLLEKLRPAQKRIRHPFWLVLGVLLVCWLPVIIAYFPGITGYDMDSQIYQIQSGNYGAHHPLLHTLFIGLFYHLFGSTIGYGVHTVLQAVLLAAAIAYAMAWLEKLQCARSLWIALLIFFAVSPQHAIMSVSGTKDILFAASMLVLCVELVRLIQEPQRLRKPVIVTLDVLVMMVAGMLRNNAIYGFVLVLAVAVLFFRRGLGIRMLAVLLAGVIAAHGGTTLLNKAVNAHGTSMREKVCVPAQQLARVYDKYELSVPVGYEIREVLPYAEDYHPDRADHVKRAAKVTTNERLVRFLKLWGRELFHYPVEYIDAFLLNAKGFWYPGDYSFAVTYDIDEPTGCMVLKHNSVTGIGEPWMLPGLRSLLEKLFVYNAYRSFLPGWLLIHPATYTWLLAFLFAWAVWRRRGGVLLGLGVLLSYLLTLLLGPCALIRYQYDLMLAGPVLMGCLSVRKQ